MKYTGTIRLWVLSGRRRWVKWLHSRAMPLARLAGRFNRALQSTAAGQSLAKFVQAKTKIPKYQMPNTKIPNTKCQIPKTRHQILANKRFVQTKLTLADEDTNSILTDNANTSYTSYTSYINYTSYTRLYTSYKLYTEKVTVSSGAIWWPNLELMQVAPSGGQICN